MLVHRSKVKCAACAAGPPLLFGHSYAAKSQDRSELRKSPARAWQGAASCAEGKLSHAGRCRGRAAGRARRQVTHRLHPQTFPRKQRGLLDRAQKAGSGRLFATPAPYLDVSPNMTRPSNRITHTPTHLPTHPYMVDHEIPSFVSFFGEKAKTGYILLLLLASS